MKKKKIRICDITYITKNTVVSVLVVVLLTGLISITAVAETGNRAANIKSKGIFEYQNYTAVFDASDLVYLADEIDLLEDTYKEETVEALNQIGTYYRIDGTATHDAEENTLPLENANMLDFSVIKSGIINSQSIPSDRTYSGSIPGSDDAITGNISAATAENLSLGTAAWVDGELIVGTGADNNSYYTRGINDAEYKRIKVGEWNSTNTNLYESISCCCTNINNWQNLTADSFFMLPSGVTYAVKSISVDENVKYYYTSENPVLISYDEQTGYVTVSGLLNTYQNHNSYIKAYLNGIIYCYVKD